MKKGKSSESVTPSNGYFDNEDTLKLEEDAEWISGNDLSSKANRAYIGNVTPDISKAKLQNALQEQIGRVLDIDMITSKNCAFATFASKEGYNDAIEQGIIYINEKSLVIEQPKPPRHAETADGRRRRKKK